MGTFSKLYNNFIGGQIDDTMTGRIESDQYQTGASKLENVIVKADGSVSKRPGLMRRDDGSAIGKYTKGDGKYTVREQNWIQKTLQGVEDIYSLETFFDKVSNTGSIYHSATPFMFAGRTEWNDFAYIKPRNKLSATERRLKSATLTQSDNYFFSYTFDKFVQEISLTMTPTYPRSYYDANYANTDNRFQNYFHVWFYDKDGIARWDLKFSASADIPGEEIPVSYVPLYVFPGCRLEFQWLGILVYPRNSEIANVENYLNPPSAVGATSISVLLEDGTPSNSTPKVVMTGWTSSVTHDGGMNEYRRKNGFVCGRNVFMHRYGSSFEFGTCREIGDEIQERYSIDNYDKRPVEQRSEINKVNSDGLLEYTSLAGWVKKLHENGFPNGTYDRATNDEGESRFGNFSCGGVASAQLMQIQVSDESVKYSYYGSDGNSAVYEFASDSPVKGAPTLTWWDLETKEYEAGEGQQEITQKGDIDDARIYFLTNGDVSYTREKKFFIILYLTNGIVYARPGRFLTRKEEEEGNVWYKMETDSLLVSSKSFKRIDELCVTPNGMKLWITDAKEEPFTISVDPDKMTLSREEVTLTSLTTTNAIYGWRLGFPSVNWFSGMRWFLSGFSKAPGTIIASRVPDADGNSRYTDFTLYDLVTDSATGTESKSILSSHGILLTEDIPLLHNYRLNWVAHGIRDLFAYEDVVMMDSGRTPTPTSYDLVPTLYGGFGNVKPACYGGAVFFTGANNNTIRCMYYDDNAGGYVQSDITGSINEVIDKAGGVVRLAVQPGQNIYLWAVLADGTALCGLLVSTAQVAWALEKSFKWVLDVEPAYYTSSDGHNYERMMFCMANKASMEIAFMDCEYSKDERVTSYLDLSYVASVEQNPAIERFDGKYFYTLKKVRQSNSETVFDFTGYVNASSQLVIDNMMMFAFNSPSGQLQKIVHGEDGESYELTGIVSEKKAVERWGFGTPYTSSVQTLPMAYDEQNGIMFCRSRHINDIIFRVKNTGNFDVICNDPVSSEQVFNTKFYQEYNGGEAVPFKSGNYRMQFTSTVSDDAQIELRSDLPYPFNLLAMVVVGRVEDRL